MIQSSCSPVPCAPAWRAQGQQISTSQRAERSVIVHPRYADSARTVDVRYLWCGAPGTPTVIVQGGISAGRDVLANPGDSAPGWWRALVGSGCAVDLEHFRVLAIDWLTPAELRTGAVSSEDQADALAALLHDLGVAHVHAFIGASYGAMVGLAFAARHARSLQRMVLLAGAHRAHPLATAQRCVQRDIVRMAQSCGRAREGLALARQLAVTTYRGSEEFARRFHAAPELRDDGFHFPVADYLQYQGQRFAAHFDADRFLALSESIDLHDVAPECISTPATLVGFASDRLVPLADMCELQQRLGGPATLAVVASPYGHDGFLKEPEQLAPLLREALV